MENIDRYSELLNLYLDKMQIIKYRVRAIKEIISEKTTTSYKMTNIEFCLLQIRKILEMIVLSSLVANRDAYEAIFPNAGKMWNLKNIIKDVSRIHPHFYPKPIIIDPNDKYNWLKRSDDYLTQEKCIQIWECCGKYLHETPINMTKSDIDNAYKGIEEQIPQWIQLIINLLNPHNIMLYNQKALYYVAMGVEGQHPFGNVFEQVSL